MKRGDAFFGVEDAWTPESLSVLVQMMETHRSPRAAVRKAGHSCSFLTPSHWFAITRDTKGFLQLGGGISCGSTALSQPPHPFPSNSCFIEYLI